MRGLLLATLGAVSILAACGGGSTPTPTPTAPTTPAATVASLTISQLSSSLKPGDTAQLTATATLTDGTTQTATALAAWSTSASAILRVSTTGLVTAVGDGDATITASYGSRTATADLSVRTGGQALQGLVTETAPTTTRVVAGAQVLVVDGLYRGASATTDATGRFTIANVAGSLSLRISKDGFEPLTLTADAGGIEVAFRLMPALRSETTEVRFACSNNLGSPCERASLRDQGKMTFDLHRSGTVTLSANAAIQQSDSWPYCAELRDTATNQVLSLDALSWQVPFNRAIDLAGGRTYELRVYSCPSGGLFTGYTLRATHPY